LEDEPINALKPQPVRGAGHRAAFTLVELLVAMGIISALMAISMPVFSRVRSKALELKGTANLNAIFVQLNSYADDHEDRYPPSVATVGSGSTWSWYDPRRLVSVEPAIPGVLHRSVSAYLHDYIEDARILSCPSVPFECQYIRQMWEAGDDWHNPNPASSQDLFTGSYCFYWNYTGLLDPVTKRTFKGPFGPAGGRGYSRLLVSDHFGYGNGWDIPPSYAYGSCEPFDGSTFGNKSDVPRWISENSGSGKVPPEAKDNPKINLKAAYIDGHVERYPSSEVAPMWVIKTLKDSIPYSVRGEDNTPGLFFLPNQAIPTR
jgi:prepilin-type N-terminal cleavage/methylation domain-containing protein